MRDSQIDINGVTEEGGGAGGGDGRGAKGMQVTAAGKAHIMQAKSKQGSRISLKPIDIVNKEIAEKRRRDKVCK